MFRSTRLRSTPPPWSVLVVITAVLGSGWMISACATASTTTTSAVLPRPSAGCSPSHQNAPVSGSVISTGPSGGSNWTEYTVSFSADGDTGSYLEELPPVTERPRPLPVVFDLHGYLEPDTLQDTVSGLSTFGKAHGFVTVTPQIDGEKVPHWNASPDSADVAYLGSLFSHVENTVCVDEARVFLTGYSNGAWMASRLACAYSARIAAVAPVAGLQDYPDCGPARPVPVVTFHGTADPFVAFNGGSGANAATLPPIEGSGGNAEQTQPAGSAMTGFIGPLPQPIPAQVAGWARRNGCGRSPNRRNIGADVTLLSYPCLSDASVNFYEVSGGGHTWPGSPTLVSAETLVGRTTMTISATQIIWQFFQNHPLPAH